MNQLDAQKSLDLYKGFVAQTKAVNDFLDNARKFQFALTVEIPILQVVRVRPLSSPPWPTITQSPPPPI